MTTDTDILIAGGGLNGASLALALAGVGLRVTLVDLLSKDTRADPEFDGRGYALALTSVRMLKVLGVWNAVEDKAQPILDIKVADGRPNQGASPLYVHFDHHEIEEGPMGHMLEDRFLRQALLNAVAAEARITHLSQVAVVSQEVAPGHVDVGLSDGNTQAARLLVGCDGRQSEVATRAGISRTGWDYTQASLVCAVRHEKPHGGCAHQLFLPSGPLAILPLPGNRSSVVWTETRDRAVAIQAMPPEAYLDALRPVFGNFLGEISLDGGRFLYPLGLSLANRIVAQRVALVGDAAHGIHPLAGQGLNLGLRDVAALAEVLADAARRGEDYGTAAALRPYETWRRFDIAALAAATDGINRLFSNDNTFLRGIRDIGLGLANALPGVRKGMIREAAGLTGDLPRLMQGLKV